MLHGNAGNERWFFLRAASDTPEDSSIKRAHRAVALWEKSKSKLTSSQSSSAFNSKENTVSIDESKDKNDNTTHNNTANIVSLPSNSSKRNLSNIQKLENSQKIARQKYAEAEENRTLMKDYD